MNEIKQAVKDQKVTPETIARTIVLFVALINQALVLMGKGTIPIVENDIYQLVSLIATIGSALWAWWKNNSFTKAAMAGDYVMNEIKEQTDE